MKWPLCFIFILHSLCGYSQTLQLHYDVRHTINPEHNDKNFPTLYFEYFKTIDSGKSFIKPGSFLLKMQADFPGENNNMAKFYMQVSQTFRCWQPKFFVNVQYSGGLGVTQPKQYSYYITNTYSFGIAYPFKIKQAYLNAVLNYKLVMYAKPSNDFLYTLYWWQGLFNYKAEFSGDFSIWTENKNHGDDVTKQMHGKRFSFFAEPQCWYNINKTFSVGSKFNMNYHVNTFDNRFEVYPTAAIRCKL